MRIECEAKIGRVARLGRTFASARRFSSLRARREFALSIGPAFVRLPNCVPRIHFRLFHRWSLESSTKRHVDVYYRRVRRIVNSSLHKVPRTHTSSRAGSDFALLNFKNVCIPFERVASSLFKTNRFSNRKGAETGNNATTYFLILSSFRDAKKLASDYKK